MSVPTIFNPAGLGLESVATLAVADSNPVLITRITQPLPDDLSGPLAAQITAMDPWKRYAFDQSAIARFLAPAEPSAPRFLITNAEEVVGLIALKLGWMFGSYLNILAILPAHQCRGIGGAVLRWIEERARANGERNQFVVTSAFNARGLALYQRHGFQQIATMPGLINDAESEILLRKRLG